MKKRILSLCMAVLLLCSLLPQVALPARAKAPLLRHLRRKSELAV